MEKQEIATAIFENQARPLASCAHVSSEICLFVGMLMTQREERPRQGRAPLEGACGTA